MAKTNSSDSIGAFVSGVLIFSFMVVALLIVLGQPASTADTGSDTEVAVVEQDDVAQDDTETVDEVATEDVADETDGEEVADEEATDEEATDEEEPIVDDGPSDMVRIINGERIVGTTCAACHGFNYDGISGLGPGFIDNEFVNGQSNQDLQAFIIAGRGIGPDNKSGVMMPARGGNPSLSDDDILDVVYFIRSLNPDVAVIPDGFPPTVISDNEFPALNDVDEADESNSEPPEFTPVDLNTLGGGGDDADAEAEDDSGPLEFTPVDLNTLGGGGDDADAEETTDDTEVEEPVEEPADDVEADEPDGDASAEPVDERSDAVRVINGERIVGTTCAACHGFNYDGISGLGPGFIDNEFVNGQSNQDLQAFIIAGRGIGPDNKSGVMMPARGGNPSLSDADILDVVYFIRSLNPDVEVIPDGEAPTVTSENDFPALNDADAADDSEPSEPVEFTPVDLNSLGGGGGDDADSDTDE